MEGGRCEGERGVGQGGGDVLSEDSRAVGTGFINEELGGIGGDALDGDGVHGQDIVDKAVDVSEQHGAPHCYGVKVHLLV